MLPSFSIVFTWDNSFVLNHSPKWIVSVYHNHLIHMSVKQGQNYLKIKRLGKGCFAALCKLHVAPCEHCFSWLLLTCRATFIYSIKDIKYVAIFPRCFWHRCERKCMSASLGLVDFIHHLSDRQKCFWTFLLAVEVKAWIKAFGLQCFQLFQGASLRIHFLFSLNLLPSGSKL